MMNSWTNEDIEAIMLQLDAINLPFKKYRFSQLGEGMKMLGKGAAANVYEAAAKGKKAKKYAVKVIGFNKKNVDSESFESSIESQSKLEYLMNNIITIYESVELRVWIKGEHDVEKVEKIDPYSETKPCGNFLHLQFILMEKSTPVLTSHRLKHKLFPEKLQNFDEEEILKLAYDIGIAIDKAHKNNLIHRDIKLENIFYDVEGHNYKLGDFGISRITENGMASTSAFTKGYGAPEVVGFLADKYDYTADIYSFGMMLYILLNELKFPESNSYHPTLYQYNQGYVPPAPVRGSDELVRIVLKMLSFDPDYRYQTMEEVLNEFDKLKFGRHIKYQREHRTTALIMGYVSMIMGAAAWKLSFMPDLQVTFNRWEYIFFVLCMVQAVFHITRKKTWVVSTAISGIGIYLIISTGYTWWKLAGLLMLVFCHNWSGIIGAAALTANISYLIMDSFNYSAADYSDYRWIAIFMISFSVVLVIMYLLSGMRNEKIIKRYFRRNMFCIVSVAYYADLISLEVCLQNLKKPINDTLQWILSWNPGMVGICGICFCVAWTLREWLLILREC